MKCNVLYELQFSKRLLNFVHSYAFFFLRPVLNPEGSHQVVNKSTDGALELKEGVVSFSNDIYGASPSKNSRLSAVYENPMSFDNHAYEELK